MKWSGIIFAFLVLILSVQPVCASYAENDACCSKEGHCNGEEDGTASDPHKNCEDGCNPFQICSCCAFSIMPSQQVITWNHLSFSVASNTKCSILAFHLSNPPASDVWQPPRTV